MRIFIYIIILLSFATYAPAQDPVCFLNKTGRQVLVQKRTILEEGAYPHVVDSNNQVFQQIPFQIDRPVILNVSSIPPKGPYGTADGIYFLFKPGDSLVVTLDKASKPVISHLTKAERNAELNFFQNHMAGLKSTLPYQLYGFTGNQSLRKQIWSDDLKLRDRILDSLYRPYIQSVKDFSPANSPDAESWYNFYLGNLISDKLYVGYKPDKRLQSALRSFYADSLSKWRHQLNCEGCENIPPYNNALYATYALEFGELATYQFIDTVAYLAKGSNKNYLLSRYVAGNIGTANDDEELINYYKEKSSDSVYSNIVTGNYLLRKKQVAAFGKEVAVLVKADKTETGFTELIKKLEEKVVYVDFWASWCKPCIEELPYSHQLAEKLKGKDVVMLYLSIDDDFDSWQKAAAKYKVAAANSFMMPAADKTALAKQIELGPIPRYLIINKAGKIVNLNAPRPSDPETYDLLSKMLKQ